MTAKKRDGYEGASCVCPHCQADARCVGIRTKRLDTLLGSLILGHHYYHCHACHEGHFPRDRRLGLGSSHLTPAVHEVTCIAGVQNSFSQSAEITLLKMCGLRLSESTIERVTESTGARLDQLLRSKVTFGKDETWRWQRDARGKSCAYVSLDATGVRQQALQGARAEGRMAYVGMIYNPRNDHDRIRPEPHQVRYLAGFYSLDELGLQLRRQAGQVGWDEAEQQIALSDGGNGLEEFIRRNFPLAECILDFWHASDHLTQLGLALHPSDESTRKSQVTTWCHSLKHQGGLAIVRCLQQMDLTGQPTSAHEAHADCLRYFQNHQHRMEYPRYLANGWQIGSGPVESACKTVIANRLKGSGMRWGVDGANAVAHLRALYLSQPNQWDAFWKDYPS